MKLCFAVEQWLGACEAASEPDIPTLASVRIQVTTNSTTLDLTEVFDVITRTVRPHIHVPLLPLAHWLLANWWRLRWEAYRPSLEWRQAHCLAAIGGGYAWPPLEFAGDDRVIQIRMAREDSPDVAGIQYLRGVTMDIEAPAFEEAVDQFVALVRERLAACGTGDEDLEILCQELADERNDPELSRACQLQARAGFDPGTTPAGWLEKALDLGRMTGPGALNEVLAALPENPDELVMARQQVDQIRNSSLALDFSAIPGVEVSPASGLPWQRGELAARQLRQKLGMGLEPVTDARLGELLGVELPLEYSGRFTIGGGFRDGDKARVTAVMPKRIRESQRFYLSRLLGCALAFPREEHLLAVTEAKTTLQKFERAFAQEFLCPYEALDAFTAEHGLDEEGIQQAAHYFQVSEQLVLTTLVNKKKIAREDLLTAQLF